MIALSVVQSSAQTFIHNALADPRGARREGRAPLTGSSSFNFMHFGENLPKSYVGAHPLEGLRPYLGEILDPPLQCYFVL